MKLTALGITVAMMAVAMGSNAEAKPLSGRLVTVYLQDKAEVPVFVRTQAQRQASHMFAEIGVTLVWKEGNPSSLETGAIAIELGKNTPVALAPGALAFALPDEGIHIRVFCDRIDRDPAMGNPATEAVLAHVMVHEITHILQGVALQRSRDEGIMKSHWSNAERAAMRAKPLHFTRGRRGTDFYRHERSCRPRGSANRSGDGRSGNEDRCD